MEALVQRLGDVIPSARVASSAGVDKVRQETYQLAVVIGQRPQLNASLHVVQVGGDGAEPQLAREYSTTSGTARFSPSINRSGTSHATEWTVSDRAGARAMDLAIHDLLPPVPRGRTDPSGYTGSTRTLRLTQGGRWAKDDQMVPLVVDADGKVFALRVVARGGGTNWMLPSGADVEAWVRLALVQLHDLDADNFPLLSSWDTDPRNEEVALAWARPQLLRPSTDHPSAEVHRARMVDGSQVTVVARQTETELILITTWRSE